MNLDLQGLGDGGQLVIEDWPITAFDLCHLRLVDLDALPREARDHIFLRDLRTGRRPKAKNGLSRDVASFGFQSALEGAPMLLLFGTRIILSENKKPVVIMPAQAPHPLSILCVDDHTLVGDALVKVFAGAGYTVERAEDGDAAWALLSAAPDRFDVLVTDHQMPRVTGLELVERLRTITFAGRIIVYSGGLGPIEAAQYAKLGVDAVINKGPDSARLLAVVEAFHRQI